MNSFVFTGMLIISHLWMGNMEESVYLCHQKQCLAKMTWVKTERGQYRTRGLWSLLAWSFKRAIQQAIMHNVYSWQQNSHMKRSGMLIAKFEIRTPGEMNLGMVQVLFETYKIPLVGFAQIIRRGLGC